MKFCLSLLLLIFCLLTAISQTPTNAFNSTGNAGIGTTSPIYPFEITATNLTSRLGGDPSVIGIGTIGANSVNSFFGGYYSAAGGIPSSYMGSNIYFTNSGWISPDISKNTSMLLLQGGTLEFMTAASGGGYGTPKMFVSNAGTVGIGTSSPNAACKLDVRGSAILGNSQLIYLSPDYPGLGELPAGAFIGSNGTNALSFIPSANGGTAGAKVAFCYFNGASYFSSMEYANVSSGYSNLLLMKSGGNVGIGTITPKTKLEVNGTVFIGTSDANTIANMGTSLLAVRGTAVFVKAKVAIYGSTWPDYVFSPDYKLTPLDSLEQFIQFNKHLPEIPPANEVEKNGIDLGDTQVLLLKKIEELTLIIIEQNKRIEKLELISKTTTDK